MTPQKRIGVVTAGEAGGPQAHAPFEPHATQPARLSKGVRRSAHARPPGARAAPASARTFSSSASPRSCARCHPPPSRRRDKITTKRPDQFARNQADSHRFLANAMTCQPAETPQKSGEPDTSRTTLEFGHQRARFPRHSPLIASPSRPKPLSGHCRHAARQCGLRAEPDDSGKRPLSRFVGVVHDDRHVHVSGANLLAALGCGD